MIVIAHGFSRKNAGDGLLVDLTLEVLQDAGIKKEDCVVLALDAESFNDLDKVEQAPGEYRGKPTFQAAKAGLAVLGDYTQSVLGLDPKNRLTNLMNKAQGIIAVGGGYLVADSPTRNAGVFVNHLLQVRMAGRAKAPSIYLPQSIGPLKGPVAAPLKHALSKIDRIYVRDDETEAELNASNTVRCPDLAVLKLGKDLSRIEPSGVQNNPVVLVPRDLPNRGQLIPALKEVAAAQPVLWAVQAEVAGKRSDRFFIESLGAKPDGTLENVLLEKKPSLAVSVRLHGALGSLLKGVPAIHLSYERKGWGAYQDLGLSEYVHDARTFDPQKVVAQIASIRTQPDLFWEKISNRVSGIQKSYADLVSDIATRFSVSSASDIDSM